MKLAWINPKVKWAGEVQLAAYSVLCTLSNAPNSKLCQSQFHSWPFCMDFFGWDWVRVGGVGGVGGIVIAECAQSNFPLIFHYILII